MKPESFFAKWRWVVAPAVAVAAAVALAAGIAPSREEAERIGLANWGRSELNRAIYRTFALRDSANVYRTAWQYADTRERTAQEAPAPVGLAVRADADVPAALVEQLNETLRAELAGLAQPPRYAVIVRILMDETADRSTLRAIVIPPTAAGPCVVQIRLPAASTPGSRVTRDRQLLGVCGLYAKFGAPGEGMTKYLTRTSLATAGFHTAPALTGVSTDAQIRGGGAILLAPSELACSLGRFDQCTKLFDGAEGAMNYWRPYDESRLLPPRRLTNAIRIATYWDNQWESRTTTRLAALRTMLGDDRFAMLWASKEEPAVEFARREGRPLEALISDALRSPTLAYRQGSAPRGLQVVFALLLLGALAGWAIVKSPREYRP
jgi:hypothetical protein